MTKGKKNRLKCVPEVSVIRVVLTFIGDTWCKVLQGMAKNLSK